MLTDLCGLRGNVIDYYRSQYLDQVDTHTRIRQEVDMIYRGAKVLLQRYHTLEQENCLLKQQSPSSEIDRLRKINEELTIEFAKILQLNHVYENQISELQDKIESIDTLQLEKFELRQENIRLGIENRKLRERNNDLEYAINLESVSMLEAYQDRDKLFGAIDDVRRSLTRILNPV